MSDQITIVYSIVDREAFNAGGNPLRYEHNGLKARTVSTQNDFDRVFTARSMSEISKEARDAGHNEGYSYVERGHGRDGYPAGHFVQQVIDGAVAAKLSELVRLSDNLANTIKHVVDEGWFEHEMGCSEDDSCECSGVALINDSMRDYLKFKSDNKIT